MVGRCTVEAGQPRQSLALQSTAWLSSLGSEAVPTIVLSGAIARPNPSASSPAKTPSWVSVPDGGGIATADALAAIWSSTVVETDGVRLLDDDTVTRRSCR